MHYSILYILSLALLPIQNIGLDLGFMTLKLSQALFGLYLLLAVVDRRVTFPKPNLAVLLLFFSLIGLLVSSISSHDVERSATLSLAYLLCLFFLYATILYLRSTEKSFDNIKLSLYLSSTLYSIYGILQLFLFFGGQDANVNFEAWDIVPRVPYFSAENVHAAFLVAVIPILYLDFISEKGRAATYAYTIAILINLGGLVATGSRGAILALTVAVAIQSVMYLQSGRGKKSLFKLVYFVPLIAYFVINFYDELFSRFGLLFEGGDGTTSVRSSHYELIYSYFVDYPILGLGLGRSLQISGHDVHNVLLQILFEGGIISFIPFFLALLLTARHLIGRLNSSRISANQNIAVIGAFVAVIFQSLVEPSLYFYHLYFVIGLAISVGKFRARQCATDVVKLHAR